MATPNTSKPATSTPPMYEVVRILRYELLSKAKQEDTFNRDTPVVHMIAPRPVTVLPGHMIGYGVRGYCIPGLGDGQGIWMRDGDRDPWRVGGEHENIHINMRQYGGDNRGGYGHEFDVRQLENWRLGYEGHSDKYYN